MNGEAGVLIVILAGYLCVFLFALSLIRPRHTFGFSPKPEKPLGPPPTGGSGLKKNSAVSNKRGFALNEDDYMKAVNEAYRYGEPLTEGRPVQVGCDRCRTTWKEPIIPKYANMYSQNLYAEGAVSWIYNACKNCISDNERETGKREYRGEFDRE